MSSRCMIFMPGAARAITALTQSKLAPASARAPTHSALAVYSSSHEYGETKMKVPPGFRKAGTDSKKRVGDGNRHSKLAAMIRSNVPMKQDKKRERGKG